VGTSPKDVDRLLLQKKVVTMRLRGGRELSGLIHIAEGQPLSDYLSVRGSFVNLTEVRWQSAEGSGTPLPHVGIAMTRVVWIAPVDGSLHLTSATHPTSQEREIELLLVDGQILHVMLHLPDELRTSDYFESGPGFIPLRNVREQGRDTTLRFDRLALNKDSIAAIREP
jgi:hypothetical protein